MPSARRLRLPVPVSIITGSLASGKTTFIGAVLKGKPPAEVWAVLVNEFGAAGLDAALLEGSAAASPAPGSAAGACEGARIGSSGSGGGGGGGSPEGIHIRQLAGGCLCCALSNVTALAIAQLLRSVKPDRLLIEPSGLAHPAALVDMLTGEHLGPSLALQPVVCLVDVTQFCSGAATPACCDVPLLADQISIADILVGSKADACDEAALAAFRAWADGLFPPKRLIVTARQGRLEGDAAAAAAALLTWPGGAGSGASRDPSGGAAAAAAAAEAGPPSGGLPVQRPRRSTAAAAPWLSSSSDGGIAEEGGATRERPLRKQVQDGSGAHAACGWIFHRDCLFHRPRLQQLLQLLVPRTLRLKGVFRVSPKTWVAVSAAPGTAGAAAAARAADAATEVGGQHAAAAGAEAGAGSSACRAAAGAAAAVAPVELSEIAYRRDSRVEMIIDVAAAAAFGAGGMGAGGASAAASLEQQAAQLGLEDGVGLERQVAAALGEAAVGDWCGVEALLQQALECSAAGQR